jgi:hypothetical protein
MPCVVRKIDVFDHALLLFDVDSPEKGVKRSRKGKEKVPGVPATAAQAEEDEDEAEEADLA